MIYFLILLVAYAIEPCMYVDAYNTFLLHEPEKEKRNSIIGFILIYGIIVLKQSLFFLGGRDAITTLSFPMLIITMFIVANKIYKEKSIKKIVYIILSLMMLSLISDGITLFILTLLHIDAHIIYGCNFINSSITFITRIMEAFCFIFITKYCMKQRKTKSKSVNELYTIALYLMTIIVSLTVGTVFLCKVKGMACFILGIQITLVVLLGIYVFFVIQKKTKSEQNAVTQLELLKQNQILTSQARMIRDELRALRHDTRSHYGLILELAKQEKLTELIEYLENIQKDVDVSQELCTSENIALSVIVTKRRREALKKEIQFEYVITTDTVPISLFEQNTLFDNLLSNAIEACMGENIEKKMIDFSVTRNPYKQTVIECSNSIGNIPVKQNGSFLTTKKDKVNHGIGFKNIQKVVKKNHGTMIEWISEEGDQFHIQIIFNGGQESADTSM